MRRLQPRFEVLKIILRTLSSARLIKNLPVTLSPVARRIIMHQLAFRAPSFTGPSGCKKGNDCTFVHNWAAIPQAERAQRCRTRGAKGHRSAECKAGLRGEEKAKYKSPPANAKTVGSAKGGTLGATANNAVPPPPKEVSQQQIKSYVG